MRFAFTRFPELEFRDYSALNWRRRLSDGDCNRWLAIMHYLPGLRGFQDVRGTRIL